VKSPVFTRRPRSERCNVTGSARFKKLVLAGDYDAAVEVARDQVENGAQIIDVNVDEALLDSEQAMTVFLKRIAAEPAYIAASGTDEATRGDRTITVAGCRHGCGFFPSARA